jgi:hypothetical protein
MIHFQIERSNKRDHWPPGFYHPKISNLCDRSLSLSPGSVRSILKNPHSRDSIFSFIQ